VSWHRSRSSVLLPIVAKPAAEAQIGADPWARFSATRNPCRPLRSRPAVLRLRRAVGEPSAHRQQLRDRPVSMGDITAVIMTVFYLTWFGLWLRSNKW
jgi:hypothetical protein